MSALILGSGLASGNDSKKVSLIIAAYNCEQYISQALESAIGQTHSNLEILVCDDGSSDHTFHIILEWSKRDQRILAFQNESNRGIVRTRNFLLGKSTGDFITFLDADDWIGPEKIARQLAVACESGCEAVGVGYHKVEIDGTAVFNRHSFTKHYVQRVDIDRLPFWLPSIMISRELLVEVGGFHSFFADMACYEDKYWLCLVLEFCPVIFVDEPLYYYRHNPQSVTRTLNFKRLAGQVLVNELIRQRLSSHTDWLQSGQQEVAEHFIQSYLSNKAWRRECFRQYAAIKTDERLYIDAIIYLVKGLSVNSLNRRFLRTTFYLIRSLSNPINLVRYIKGD